MFCTCLYACIFSNCFLWFQPLPLSTNSVFLPFKMKVFNCTVSFSAFVYFIRKVYHVYHCEYLLALSKYSISICRNIGAGSDISLFISTSYKYRDESMTPFANQRYFCKLRRCINKLCNFCQKLMRLLWILRHEESKWKLYYCRTQEQKRRWQRERQLIISVCILCVGGGGSGHHTYLTHLPCTVDAIEI